MTAPRCHLLLVEDNQDDVLFMRMALENLREDIELHVVEDGEQAITYLSGKSPYAERAVHPLPALILLDLKLPRRSGHDVLRWVKSQPGIRRIPVNILSSSSHPSDINQAYDLGANSYLLKPVGIGELNQIVKGVISYWTKLSRLPDSLSADGSSAPPGV